MSDPHDHVPAQREGRISGPPGQHAEARFAIAITSLTEAIEEELLPEWISLTGLQVVFLKKVARGGRVTRTELMRGSRTSRSAAIPGLASLLLRGFLIETSDGAESALSMGPAGIEVLADVARVRATWVRHAMADAREDMRCADLDRAADLLVRLLETTTRP
ncbi:MarR family transcriptional regulator [Clavibacter sp. B3I6]|uniref:MarR family transcriptional regulator n=1 Tax=Clavibacter sp. B3I6 TaxID=3042268 RepID=UPI0027D7CB69|nr:MarR family transcriptional regulator [Clavibacter sp. B3I6]